MAGLAALVSVVANEALFRYFSCVGKELRSQTMIANAWSNRGEAFGSSAVIVGVVGAQFGFSHLDPIASLVVSAIIFKYSYGIVRDAVTGLMDRSLPPSALRELRQTIAGVDAVKSIRHLRARLVGDQVWVDVLLGADQTCTMQQCEELRARVDRAVRKATCGVGQVQIDFESA
jgi:cation diffusion facilitator family transporter